MQKTHGQYWRIRMYGLGYNAKLFLKIGVPKNYAKSFSCRVILKFATFVELNSSRVTFKGF